MLPLLLALSTAHAVDVPHETFTLDNGLEVVLIPDRRVPKVVVDVWYDVGSYDDPAGRSGFAHLFEHLMFKGTERVGEGQFDALMEQAGGWNNATTSDDRTNYFNVGPSSALELLLWLEADRMTSLDITQPKLDVEREVVRNEKRQNYEDRPYGGVWIELPFMLFGSEDPRHRPGIGSHEELMASTLDDVTAFYETWYVPSNAVLAVAGDFDPAATRAMIERLFGPLPTRPKPERPTPSAPERPFLKMNAIQDDVSSSMQVMACHAPPAYTDEDAALDVLALLLAGSNDARLSRKLVLTNIVPSVDVGVWSGRWSSLFIASVTHRPAEREGSDMAAAVDDTVQAMVRHDIRRELEALAGEKPATQDEISRAVRNLEVGAIRGVETLLGRAEQLQRYRMYAGKYDHFEDDLARYRRVTPQAIAAQAARLADGACAWIVVDPRTGDTGGGEQ